MPSQCTCPAQNEGGQVLLFYRYFANDPILPDEYTTLANEPEKLADFHRELAGRFRLGGKFRIAKEGFNITLGGTTSSIEEYISTCVQHWSFANIPLSTSEEVRAFFKPTPGCVCAFPSTSIRVTSEITPLGITDYAPHDWSSITSLSPPEFHALCERGDIPLVDVRNHYESRIGYFITSKGEVAVRPEVRRFSQWPAYVSRHILGDEKQIWQGQKGKSVATYCTGGIRCEKGSRWLAERLVESRGEDEAGDVDEQKVYTLHGGIVAYQEWFSKEVVAGRKTPNESFFKGRNYVFDGRGAITMEGIESEPVSRCWGCEKSEDRIVECDSEGCHLEIVVCQVCELDGVACCTDCRSMKKESGSGKRRMCECERSRETGLWGDGGAKIKQTIKSARSKDKAI